MAAPPRPLLRLRGSEGNRRITAATAVVLLVLLAAEAVTLIDVHGLITWHVAIGILLVPPVLLKLASTSWRFVRYYSGSTDYRRAGPPLMPLRVLAPFVVASTCVLFGTGVALAVLGPRDRGLVGLHKASFVVWFLAMSVHVLGHLLELPRLTAADWLSREARRASRARRWLLVLVIGGGVVLAVSTLHLAAPWHHFHRFDAGG
jgi:uncharacterized membrane protein